MVDFPTDFLFDYRRVLRISGWIGVTNQCWTSTQKVVIYGDVSPTIGEVLSNLELKYERLHRPPNKGHSTKKIGTFTQILVYTAFEIQSSPLKG